MREMMSHDDENAAVWLLERLAQVVQVQVDPVALHQTLRHASSLVDAAATVGLSLEPAHDVGEAALPLGSVSPPLVVLERRGDQLLIERPNEAPSWVDAVSVPAGLTWFSAVERTPLQRLAGDHPSPLARLASLVSLERADLQAIALYAAGVGLFSLATPVAVQALVSSVAFGTLLQPIVVLSVLLLAALAFQSTLKALQARLVEGIEARLFVRTALDFAWRLPRVKKEEADHGFGPTTINRFFEVATLQKTASVLLTDGIATVLTVGIGLIVLAFYHPALLAFTLVVIALIVVVVLVPSRHGLSTSIEESAAKYEVAAWLQTIASSTAVLKGPGERLARERADALTRRYLAARGRHFRVLFGQTLSTLGLQIIASVALLGLGGWLVVQRELTLGQLIAAELIVSGVTQSLSKVGKLLDSTYDLLTSIDKLGHVIDLPIEADERDSSIPGSGPLQVELVHAADHEHPPVSLRLAAGERVAISASERPLVEWVAGLRLPNSGSVLLNGVETSRARGPSFRTDLALLHRDDLFEGSVLENLTLGRDGLLAEHARAALEKVDLLDTIRSLPQGLDTPLERGGAPLTPSQAARLLVARAIASNPRLIVLDDLLEAVEPAARSRCLAALTAQPPRWTLAAIVADTDGPVARACQRVISLDEVAS